mmetsp:Transcript_85118/g.197920  ORF Transcript_85118/g.197920 Transcript_85118/m.197920 type:complete len:111 (-) Transcript_85118:5-337(-)
MAGRSFLEDIPTSDEMDLPSHKAVKEPSFTARKPPAGWSAERSSQNTALRRLGADAAAFKGVDEGGTGELTSEGPGLPFRIKESKLIPHGLGKNTLTTITMPHDLTLQVQ